MWLKFSRTEMKNYGKQSWRRLTGMFTSLFKTRHWRKERWKNRSNWEKRRKT